MSGDLGGGSIGLAPYGLHGEDSHPPHNHLGRGDGVSQRDFTDPGTIAVWSQSYGPVYVPTGDSVTDYVTIEVQNTSDPCQWTDSLAMFEVILHPDLNNNSQVDPDERRYIGLRQNGHIPVPGIYRVSCYLPCDDLETVVPVMVSWPGWTPPPGLCIPHAFAPSHVFRIWPDCDDDGLNDLLEIDGNGSLDTDNDDVLDSCEASMSCNACDVNNSGFVTVQDIFDFLAAYFQSPACIAPVTSSSCSTFTLPTACAGVDADVNDSCTVSVQDIFDFLFCYFSSQGPCP